MPAPSGYKTVQARILEYAEAEGTLPGQFCHSHTDIYGIPALVIECMNTNRNEEIAPGAGGSLVLQQGVTDIHNGVDDEKRRQVVAKLADVFLEQDIPKNLSQVVRDLPQQQNTIAA